jgi:hypothetical protein
VDRRQLVVLVVPAPPAMTDMQIAAAFEHWLGRGPRRADLVVCEVLGRSAGSVAEFIWNQAGEPVKPTPREIRDWVVEYAVG